MQRHDDKLQEIIKKLHEKEKQIANEFAIEKRTKGRHNEKKLYVVSKTLRFKVVQSAHDNCGHLSVDRTLEKLQHYMWLSRINRTSALTYNALIIKFQREDRKENYISVLSMQYHSNVATTYLYY